MWMIYLPMITCMYIYSVCAYKNSLFKCCMYLCDNYDTTQCLILGRQVTKYLCMTVHTVSLFLFHMHRSQIGQFAKITSIVTVHINGRCHGLAWNSDVGVLNPSTSGVHWGNQVKKRLSGKVLINRTNVLMAKEQETDRDAEGRRRPQADGRGRPREEPRPPTPVCLRFKPWSVGPSRPPGGTHTEDHKGISSFPGAAGGGGREL